MMHPAVLILLLACLVILIQSLQATELLMAGLPLLAVAYIVPFNRWVILLYRTRWIMLSLFLIYSFATPGAAVWVSLAQFSPTHEGLSNGLLQLGRLALTLASLAILLRLLPQQRPISGLNVLTYPLRYVGLSRERLAVRLALTLQYAELVRWGATGDWRVNIGQMLAPVEVNPCTIELRIAPFTIYDGMILAVGCALFVFALL